MISFRGDAHRFYLKLKNNIDTEQDLSHLKEIQEVKDIQLFYSTLSLDLLQYIRYRMIKEKSASGIVPILVTTVPWILFIFGNKVEEMLTYNDSKLWLIFAVVYLIAVIVTVYLHFKERAWATLHIEVLDHTISKKREKDIKNPQ